MSYQMMFGFFRKKDKNKSSTSQAINGGADVSHLSDAKQQLFAQLKAARAELGEEEIAKMQKAVKMETLRKQMKSDIDNDPKKRDRLLDEIRLGMRK